MTSLRLPRRGPRPVMPERVAVGDLAFRAGAGGVMLAAMVLGVVLGSTHPTWMLAVALLGMGGLLAAYVLVRAKHTQTA